MVHGAEAQSQDGRDYPRYADAYAQILCKARSRNGKSKSHKSLYLINTVK